MPLTARGEEVLQKLGRGLLVHAADHLRRVMASGLREEARTMLERISKAQLVHSLQNGGSYADLATLVSGGLLPEDVKTSHSTGYNYTVELTADKKRYTATATPATYGRSGKLSFLLQLDEKGTARVSSRDIGGKAIVK